MAIDNTGFGGRPFPGPVPLPGGPTGVGAANGGRRLPPPPPPPSQGGFGQDSFTLSGAAKASQMDFGGRPAPGTPGYDASLDEHVNGSRGAGSSSEGASDPFGGRPAPGTPGYDPSLDEHVNGANASNASNASSSENLSLKEMLQRLLSMAQS
ncbi:MAG: hypothetical protein JWM80_2122 [Cyanobacteria bacterium RYN_339]|nr:hypothetical protein [Cyanobacteria bacterium RYN_339]